jgi:hypothetical protein
MNLALRSGSVRLEVEAGQGGNTQPSCNISHPS